MEDDPPTIVLLRGIDAHAATQAMQTSAQCDETSGYLNRLQAAIEVRKREMVPEDERKSLTTLLETHRVADEGASADCVQYSRHGIPEQIREMRRVGYFTLGRVRLSLEIDISIRDDEESRDGSVQMVLKRSEKRHNSKNIPDEATIWSFDFDLFSDTDYTAVLSKLRFDDASTLLADSGVKTWVDRVSDVKPEEENAAAEVDESVRNRPPSRPLRRLPHPTFSPDEERIRSFASNLVHSLFEVMSIEPRQADLWSKSDPAFADPGADRLLSLMKGIPEEDVDEDELDCYIPCPSFAQICHNIKTMRNYDRSRYRWNGSQQ